MVEGQYPECALKVRSVRAGRALLIEGSLARFLQGHNVFGSVRLGALCREVLERVTQALGIEPSDADRRAWERGQIRLQRVDITRSFRVGNPDIALRICREIAFCLLERGWKIASEYEWETIYFRKRSRRYSWKFYVKGLHLQKYPLPVDLPMRERVLTYARKLLRAELVLRSTELHDRELSWVRDWKGIDLAGLWATKFARLELRGTIRAPIPVAIRDQLSLNGKRAYQLWMDEHEVEDFFSAPTVRGLLKRFEGLGIDLGRPRPRKPRSQVPLQQLLREERLTRSYPTFAKGTPLFFKPFER